MFRFDNFVQLCQLCHTQCQCYSWQYSVDHISVGIHSISVVKLSDEENDDGCITNHNVTIVCFLTESISNVFPWSRQISD